MIKKSKFKDLVIIKNTSFRDKRGYFKELLREKKLKKKISISSDVIFKKKCNSRSSLAEK